MNIEDIDIDVIINKRFVKPINRKYNKLIKNINNDSFRHSESLGLIKQIDLSLKNIKYNIDRGNLVDANSLLRAIVEYISMATMIQYDEETYLEFINLSLKNSKRKKTNPKKLIENFSNKLNDILSELYNLENDDLFLEQEEKVEVKTPIYQSFDPEKEDYVTYNVHIVREDDNIDSICLKYGVTKEDLSYYNDINTIKLGDKLIVPNKK